MEKQKGGIEGLTLEQEESFQFQTSQRMNVKSSVPGEEKQTSLMQQKPYDVNLDEGSLPSKLRKTKQLKKKKRDTYTHAQFCGRLQRRHQREWEGEGPTYSTAYLQPRKV